MRNFLLSQTTKQAAIIIIFFNAISLLLGILRESIMARYFGTSAEYDILLVAISIPNLIGGILYFALPSASIPYFQKVGGNPLFNKGAFGSTFFGLNSIMIITLTAAIFVFLPVFRPILSKGLAPDKVDLVITYGRILCLLIPFRAYEALLGSLLNSRHRFISTSAASLFLNLAVISIIIAFFPSLGSKSYIIAWLAGASLAAISLVIPAYFIKRDAENIDSEFDKFGYIKILGSIIIIDGLGLIIDPFDRFLGSIFLAPGYVSAVNYANVIATVPIRILMFSLGTAIFPSLTEKAAASDTVGISGIYHRAMAVCILVTLPMMTYFLIFVNDIVRILFEHGKFMDDSRLMTVSVLTFYLLGSYFMAAFYIQLKMFYAMKTWKPVVAIRVFSLVVKCLIGILFIRTNWSFAIAGGTIISMAISFIFLEFYLTRWLKIHYSKTDRQLIAKALYSALVLILSIIVIHLLFSIVNFGNIVIEMAVCAFLCCVILILLDKNYSISGLRYSLNLLKIN